MRWLLENALPGQQANQTAASGVAPAVFLAAPQPSSGDRSNMVIILSVLLCALVLGLGLNYILRCVARCSRSSSASSSSSSSSSSFSAFKGPHGGLRNSALRRLPLTVYGAVGDAAECPICLLDFVEGDQVRTLPGCGHAFHAQCVDAWLISNSSCPTCRHSLLTPDGDSVGKERVAAADPEPRMGYHARGLFVPSLIIPPPPPPPPPPSMV